MLDEMSNDYDALGILVNLSMDVDKEYPIGHENDTLGTLAIQVLAHAAKHIRRELVAYSAMKLLWREVNDDECVAAKNENF